MTSPSFRDRYGPVAIVTGASSGIGQAFAFALAERSLDVVLVARRADRLNTLAKQIETTYRVRATVLIADFAEPEAARRVIAATAHLDIGLLVANAGFGSKGAFVDDDPSALTEMIMVNAIAPMLLAHGVAPQFVQRGRGGILFTSSVEGLIGCPYSAGYSASKAMVKALGEALWGELTPQGVDVLVLCPGPTESEAAAKQGIDPTTLRNVQRAEDVAGLALDGLGQGPVLVPNQAYRDMFDRILSRPRDQALRAMAEGMRR